ncbi:O-antigen ligase family protein [Bradyrhizobium liaoningense]|uniref:O-antigen ligase family protein n=1 Tax=Bradyrhizobium liaoningense TaxID=43992 RepID=UPI001BA5AEE4|nr:hypothetical protein [Bradyrhizobium liaoningense]MBR1171016.1 hypothetical protein [Bradyrhizobium liaoningense]
MSIASYLLVALLATAPAAVVANDGYEQPAILLLIALALAFAAIRATPPEIALAKQTLKRFILAILAPIVWMIVQIIPSPVSALANPIWAAAAIALNAPSLSGHISINPSATLHSLVWFLAVITLIVSTVIVTKDRRRAELILLASTAAATLAALAPLLARADQLPGMAPFHGASSKVALAALLAALANGAIIAMAIERHLNHCDAIFSVSAPRLLQMLLGICGVAVSAGVIAACGQIQLLSLAGLGFALMLFVAVVRRLGLRPWLATILATILFGAAGAGLAGSAATTDLLRLAESSTNESFAIAQRALLGSPWLGNGVGSFSEVSRVYQNHGTSETITAPSTAISLAIEWGRPAPLVLAALSLQLFFFSLRGAISRGRDSFFASLAAAGILCTLCASFGDPGLLTPAVQILLAVMIGLGISQCAGRTKSV